MIIENKYWRYFAFFLIIIAIGVSFNIGIRRYFYEQSNKKVDLVISHKDIKRLALLSGINKSDLYKRLIKEAKISSVALEEETLEDFIEEGKVTVLKGSEIVNMLRVGKVYRYFLTYLSNKVNEDLFYLVIDQISLYDRIRDFLKAELGKNNVTEMGWNILEVADELQDLKEIGLGISPTKAKEIHNFGLAVIPRIKNSYRLNKKLINLKFMALAEATKSNTVVFEGGTILGYPRKISLVKNKLQAQNLHIGIIEFSRQLGSNYLAQIIPKSVIRVHSITDTEMESISVNKAIHRYIRAVKERSARILFLHPFYNYYGDENIADYNLKYFNKIKTQLEDMNYKIGTHKKLPITNFKPASLWEIGIISIGIFVSLLILFHYFYSIKLGFVIILSSIFLGIFYLCHIFNIIDSWNRFMALLSALIFPTLAIISQFPRSKSVLKKPTTIINSFIFLLKVLFICLIGALFIIGLLSDPKYLLGINYFKGIKLSFLLPLFLIGFYFYIRPHRIKAFIYILKRLFFSPIKTGPFLAILFASIFVFIYILRSGNYISFHIPFAEQWLRDTMENLLWVRPRTKEFLIGYPFLIFTYVFIDKYISRNWLWFFMILGSVALISVINSFCHIYTPLLISLYRTSLGITLGLFIGFGVLWIFKILNHWFNRYI